MSDGRRQPDPERRGTVYRSRPRLRLGRGDDGRPPSLRRERSVPGPDLPPPPGEATRPDPDASYDAGYRDGYDAGPQGYGSGPGYGSAGQPHGPGGRPSGPGGQPYPSPQPGRSPLPPGAAVPRGFRVLPDRGGPGARPRIRARWVVLALVLLLVVYPLALFWVAWSHLGKVAAMPSGTRPADTPGRTYLVVGSDSRSALTPAERSRLGTGQAVGGRTDTIMLLHVPSGGGPTVLISVPRDSYVSIPGHGKNKINAAYAFGGPQLLVRTVENATGVHVDEYVETGLLGYSDLVDAVGGVTVCVKKPINDTKAHINLKAGCQDFDGRTALGYARARYSDPRGDLGRVERQRQVLAAIAGKTLSPSVILLPWRSFPAASAGGGALTVDDGTSPWGLVSFVLAMREVAGGGGLSLTVPISDPNLSTPAGSSVAWDNAKAKTLFDNLRRDDTEAIRPLAGAQKKTASG
jgi:LCP family protein required for cell wall assembly